MEYIDNFQFEGDQDGKLDEASEIEVRKCVVMDFVCIYI